MTSINHAPTDTNAPTQEATDDENENTTRRIPMPLSARATITTQKYRYDQFSVDIDAGGTIRVPELSTEFSKSDVQGFWMEPMPTPINSVSYGLYLSHSGNGVIIKFVCPGEVDGMVSLFGEKGAGYQFDASIESDSYRFGVFNNDLIVSITPDLPMKYFYLSTVAASFTQRVQGITRQFDWIVFIDTGASLDPDHVRYGYFEFTAVGSADHSRNRNLYAIQSLLPNTIDIPVDPPDWDRLNYMYNFERTCYDEVMHNILHADDDGDMDYHEDSDESEDEDILIHITQSEIDDLRNDVAVMQVDSDHTSDTGNDNSSSASETMEVDTSDVPMETPPADPQPLETPVQYFGHPPNPLNPPNPLRPPNPLIHPNPLLNEPLPPLDISQMWEFDPSAPYT